MNWLNTAVHRHRLGTTIHSATGQTDVLRTIQIDSNRVLATERTAVYLDSIDDRAKDSARKLTGVKESRG